MTTVERVRTPIRIEKQTLAYMRRVVASLVVAGPGACTRPPTPMVQVRAAEPMMIGEFLDDYGERHSISASEWMQAVHSRYHIARWATREHFLIAQNDSANTSAARRWTRIDWVRLDGVPPYTWAFCFSAYDALTAAAAESTHVAKPDTPRTGCNGHPFTRMKRVEP